MAVKKVDISSTTREAILDASEKCFADKGFYGATVSEIFEEAGANRGLLTYYFSSKAGLFETTISRRREELEQLFRADIEKLLKRTKRAPTLEQICLSYVNFFLRLAYDSGPGWHNYLKLLANANSVYDEDAIRKLLAQFNFILDESKALLRRALPSAPEEALERGILYLEACTSTLLLSSRFISERIHRVGPIHAGDIAEDMARFFARGIAVHTS